MSHPFEKITSAYLPRLFFPLLVLTVILMAIFGVTGVPLNTAAASNGIVSFELAGSPERAAEILASWSAVQGSGSPLLRAAFVQGLDFLFIPIYSSAVAVACIWSARRLRSQGWPLARAGIPAAWSQWLAGLFDVVENIALVILLFGRVSSPWPRIAWICALTKFTLLFAGLTYGFYGMAVHLVAGLAQKKRATL